MNIRKLVLIVSLVAVLVAGTVISAGAETPMQVSGFQASYAAGRISASLKVQDALNQPVARARVKLSFEKEGLASIHRSGKTDASGQVSLSAALSSGTWKVCVDEIHKRGFDYSPATDLCTTVIVP